MAAKRKATNGNETNGKTPSILESAMASLARTIEETQRRMDDNQRRTDERSAQVEARTAQAEERIARAEERHNELRRHTDEMVFELSKSIARIEATLDHHTKVLERLPETIRQQIGFGRQGQP